MDALTADDAHRALALVESDQAARARFVASFSADGDAIAILRATVHPDAAAQAARTRELDDLRRTAFGRTNTPDEEAAATAAHAAVAEAERERSIQRAALASAVAAVFTTAPLELDAGVLTADVRTTRATAGVTEAGVFRSRPRWRRLALPVGAFVLGAAVAAVVAGAVVFPLGSPSGTLDAPTANPGEDTLVIPGAAAPASAHPGDIDAAERWLERPQTEADLIPGDLDAIVPLSTRLAFGGVGGSVWVAHNADGDLCVVASTQIDGVRASSCAPPESFVVHGAMVSVGGMVGSPSVEATWDGANVYLTVTAE